jgi:hypothetical protein
MVQVLHISNGETINQKLKVKDNRLGKLLAANQTDEQIVEEAYLQALSRFPTAEEKTRIQSVVAEAQGVDRREVLEDVVWGILSSREFLFNH